MHDMGDQHPVPRVLRARRRHGASVINSSLAHFAEEYEEHVRLGRCPLTRGAAAEVLA